MHERRHAIELRFAGSKTAPRLEGYAAVFDAPSEDLGGFVEHVRRGAFTRTLREAKLDPLALVHHDARLVLGRRSAGTLRLSEDDKGLLFEIDLPNTQTAHELAVSVERRDITGASFAFTVPPGGDKWTFGDGAAVRELIDIDLHEISITATPAYPDTEVAKRALGELRRRPRLAHLRRFLETCE
jgi:HK97 family phage prohead protease